MRLAVFDFDGTLFTKDTIPFLVKQLLNNGYSKWVILKFYIRLIGSYLLYKSGLLPTEKERLKRQALNEFHKLLKNMQEKDIDKFFEEAAGTAIFYLNKEVVKEVKKEHSEGKTIVVLSGTYEKFLKYLARHLPIDCVLGTSINYSNNGHIDYNKELEMISGSKKLDSLLKNYKEDEIDRLNSSAYADSITDLEILNYVGQPVAVNPDKKLSIIAKQRGWKII